jgi:integrase
MDKPTGAFGQPPDAYEWLGSYRPGGVDPAIWDGVRPLVWDCVRRLGYDRDSAMAWRVVRELARIATWAVSQGLPLDVEVVLDPDTVERFIAVGLADDPSRATYRAVLRRVGPRLTRKAPWQPRPATVARRQVAPPYTAGEVELLRADALVQPTRARLQAARALLALGLGAGLDGRWVARVRGLDVTPSKGAVVVRVGEPSARRVPVLAEWEDEVAALAAAAGGRLLVGGDSSGKNRAGQLAAWLVVGNGHPRFSTPRLRSTWLVTHLARGARLPELARAAGLQGVTVLSDLLEFVPPLGEADAVRMLRGQR